MVASAPSPVLASKSPSGGVPRAMAPVPPFSGLSASRSPVTEDGGTVLPVLEPKAKIRALHAVHHRRSDFAAAGLHQRQAGAAQHAAVTPGGVGQRDCNLARGLLPVEVDQPGSLLGLVHDAEEC